MRYIDIGGQVIPKHCIYGPRPAEGIVFDNYEWWSITDHLVKEHREREMAAVCKAKEEAKKEFSDGMTRTWNNTLTSIKTQGNQKRLEKAERAKQDKINQYHQILKNREEEKKEIVRKVKKDMYLDNDAIKTINSAVLFSTVMDGWRKQIEMNNFLKKEEAKREREWAMKVKKDTEDFEREKLQEKRNQEEKNRIMKEQLDAQVAEIRKMKEAEAKKRKENDERDAINMRIEGEKIHHCNMVEKEYRKKFAAKYIKKTENQLEYERNVALEEEEESEINNIYKKYNKIYKKGRAEREERMKNEQIERREKVTEIIAQRLRDAAAKEEECFQTGLKEKEEQERREEEEKKQKAKKALEDLLEGKRKTDEMRAREKLQKREEKKWEMIQQYRSAEINEELKRAEWKRVKDMNARLKADLDLQVKEGEERRAQELKEWLQPLEDEREELLRYCERTMDFIKEHNLPEDRVRTVILEMKKLYGILDEDTKQSEQKRKQQQCEQQQEGRKARPVGNGCYCLKY